MSLLTAGAPAQLAHQDNQIELTAPREARLISGRISEAVPAAAPSRQDEFSMSLEQLQVAVARGCTGGEVGAGRFAAGIRAALSFAVANPVAARALIDSRAGDPEGAENFRRLVDRFSAQLRECAPAGERLPSSSDEAVLGSIAGVVSGYLHSGDTQRLDEIAPHLVYLALLPYVGFDAARRWSEPAGPDLLGTR